MNAFTSAGLPNSSRKSERNLPLFLGGFAPEPLRRLERALGSATRVPIEDPLELTATAGDAALHGADGAARDLGSGLVREPARADQQQRLALGGGETFEGALEVAKRQVLFLAAARGR